MSTYRHCEECRRKARVGDLDSQMDWFVLRTADGSLVGDYCSSDCLAKGAAAWESAVALVEAQVE